MKTFNRIIALVLWVVICISSCFTTVFAAWYNEVAYYYVTSGYGPWLMNGSLQLLGGAGDFVSGTPFGTIIATCVSDGINNFAEYLAAGYTEAGIYAAEDDYISDLPYVAVSSNGSFVIYPSWSSNSFVDSHFNLISFNSSMGGFIVSSQCVKSFSSIFITRYSDVFSLHPGKYRFYVDSCFWNGDSLGPYYSLLVGVPGEGGTSLIRNDYSAPVDFTVSEFNSSVYLEIGYRSRQIFAGLDYLYSCSVHIELLDNTVDIPNMVSRPSSFMQLVTNYNNVDNSTNYFIGTVDADGKVTDVFDPDLYDEDTLVFTEPVTGAQYQTTGWIFDYNTRTYRLSLEPGTFLIGEADIDRIDLTYGDDALTISYYADGVLIQADTYAYVTATKKDPSTCQHSYTSEITTAATCTAPGVRTYTCSLCGDTYTEEIPQLDHVYTYETVTPPTCIDPGERKGVCSVCGAEVVEDLEPLGHDWQPTSSTQTTYALPEDAACPDCGSTSFDSVLSQSSGSYDCTCSSCGTEWIEQAVITYGQTTYTCTRCGETYVETQNADSGLFASIGNFIANGIGWIVDKLKQLIDSLSGINDIFSDFIADIKSKSGQYPAFLGAVIGVLPEDFMMVFWFAVIAGIVLAVWKLWFR